jgi:hypothetical protein
VYTYPPICAESGNPLYRRSTVNMEHALVTRTHGRYWTVRRLSGTSVLIFLLLIAVGLNIGRVRQLIIYEDLNVLAYLDIPLQVETTEDVSVKGSSGNTLNPNYCWL